ncbi:ATP-dependent sacrificial sulfur transferase LarE [Anaerosporobacter faecicola]|uniref:ATP-dependent sacrificial sulfur transferase LarE n=1 Tax=Anaerosporobacter faecicola TaxID=2718714 RepID=UPI001439E916|nr:ATP-dependent sacrificial sulfur transferase LarE [Anaerosporobacter faecicola]
MSNYRDKVRNLENYMESLATKDSMIAFSGGVDSSLLLKVACEQSKKYNTNVYAVTIHTKLHPMKELAISQKIASEVGAIHKVLHVDELQEAGIETNPVDRCYRCKKYMFTKVLHLAEELGVSILLEGTNADDTKEYRPGIQAIKELGISSPLLLHDFSKQEVRMLAKEYGISSAEKPSTPCLATRFPYDTLLSYKEMNYVEQIEEYIRSLGFYNVRARIHEKLVRIEVDEPDIMKLVEKRTIIQNYIKQFGYLYIAVDLEGFRSGSQDILIKEKLVTG